MMGRFRLLPLMAFAALCLFALKSAGLMFADNYALTGVAPASAQDKKTDSEKKDAKAEDKKEEDSQKKADPEAKAAAEPAENDKAKEAKMPAEQNRSELAVLKSLGKRRKLLDKRERELRLRENLLQAAEKRIEARIAELKVIESRIATELKSQNKEQEAQFGRLVKVYSGMKAKSAAKIFNKLDMDVLLNLVKRMKPSATSAIMAAMDTSAAQRLTLEIAKRSQAQTSAAAALPKIKSRDTP